MNIDKYTEIEQLFLTELYKIRNNPYILRRSIAAWPYFDCLQVIINKLNPVDNRDDFIFLSDLKSRIHIFSTEYPHE